ncbi:cell filamentation protein [Marininema mesophilum]|uniref:protein adenylyltransferase n=1 Tax=Marininema mesophilum TaxID=1048340 RepID=A0A1H3BB94_9BACL|nr:Fic family protein [Marininema mesophilum]SDX38911.1 cell filamentation protein [Marininema mesophilum]
MTSGKSSYLYPGTEVLINLADIKNQAELTRYESIVTAQSLAELKIEPIDGDFDGEHLRQIHYHIFKNVYPFAGEFRQVDISKDHTYFCKVKHIEYELEKLFSKLKAEKLLQGLSLEEFARRSAYYFGELNMIHPFREGNGRVQREFIRCLGLNTGYLINWDLIISKLMVDASIQSAFVDNVGLENVVRSCIIPHPSDSEEK